MKKILLSLGLLSLVATYAVADMKMENVNLGEIQVGKFYDKTGVSINTLPVVFYHETNLGQNDLVLTTQPHSNLGIQSGGKFMGEIGITDTITILNTSSITPSVFYGANIKTFTSDKTTLTETKSERYTDATIRAGYMFQYEKAALIIGLEKGVLTGDIDMEKFVGINMITNSGAIGIELRKTDLGNVDATTATISYSISF